MLPFRNAARTMIVFLVAPLAVPFIWVAIVAYESSASGPRLDLTLGNYALVFYVSALTAYLGIIIFGLPIYLFLRVKKLRRDW